MVPRPVAPWPRGPKALCQVHNQPESCSLSNHEELSLEDHGGTGRGEGHRGTRGASPLWLRWDGSVKHLA